jgi:hypothetical protein
MVARDCLADQSALLLLLLVLLVPVHGALLLAMTADQDASLLQHLGVVMPPPASRCCLSSWQLLHPADCSKYALLLTPASYTRLHLNAAPGIHVAAAADYGCGYCNSCQLLTCLQPGQLLTAVQA